ncbi:hypothetical protein POREN0001_0651 [Porphyromonas endodontalis ATCC 35406]|uniref:Uncharacterized protein n=1 Tax=Porphyromonas endodontalis (strain ATCC 35406 / DSM 24491 / JCM 8526 / CCUG 16442 / BCRC 14492 / NCTC 13058 / HG 370) TaxID=553175 RepID=C3JCW9_POREA|nr:hypothetical protein POREN0001_0651 [Porphyromonas endodontalis ATCC 35406]
MGGLTLEVNTLPRYRKKSPLNLCHKYLESSILEGVKQVSKTTYRSPPSGAILPRPSIETSGGSSSTKIEDYT